MRQLACSHSRLHQLTAHGHQRKGTSEIRAAGGASCTEGARKSLPRVVLKRYLKPQARLQGARLSGWRPCPAGLTGGRPGLVAAADDMQVNISSKGG